MLREPVCRAAGAWELTFLLTAAATVCAGLDWLSVLLGSAAALLLRLLPLQRCGCAPRLPLLRLPLLLWLPVLLWVASRAAGALFPDAGGSAYVPAVVLALAWLLARRPQQTALACCAVLSYFSLIALVVVLAFALPDVRLAYLAPQLSWQSALVAFAAGSGVWLLGAAGVRGPNGFALAGHLLLPAAAAVVCGVLSPELARGETVPFYTLSRSISLFGVVERFEALVAACLCMGCCSAAALILHAARALLPPVESLRDGLTAAVCVGVILCPHLPLPSAFFTAATAILWVLLPGLTQSVVGWKKDEKN